MNSSFEGDQVSFFLATFDTEYLTITIFPAWASLSNLLVWIFCLWAFIQSGKVGFWLLPSSVSNGVPQISVLGLLLFDIHRTSLGPIIHSHAFSNKCNSDGTKL